ncbi:MAG: hypothetical protein HFF59_08485 [Lawsonibacter sp.]|nr:hypothetical protein [Lawsonibacter sp.]MCI9567582.1 hypothetical protein [Lawsonibacter sp.]
MKTVQRGNKQLRVADDRLEDMVRSGYMEVDSVTGQPLSPPAPADGGAALKKEATALRKENKALKEQVAELARQVEALTAQSGAQ